MDTVRMILSRTAAAIIAIFIVFPFGPLCIMFSLGLRFPDLILETIPARTSWALRRFGRGIAAEFAELRSTFIDAFNHARGR